MHKDTYRPIVSAQRFGSLQFEPSSHRFAEGPHTHAGVVSHGIFIQYMCHTKMIPLFCCVPINNIDPLAFNPCVYPLKVHNIELHSVKDAKSPHSLIPSSQNVRVSSAGQDMIHFQYLTLLKWLL